MVFYIIRKIGAYLPRSNIPFPVFPFPDFHLRKGLILVYKIYNFPILIMKMIPLCKRKNESKNKSHDSTRWFKTNFFQIHVCDNQLIKVPDQSR